MDRVAAATPSRATLLRPVRDRHGTPIDLAPIQLLVERIVARWAPDRIWLFGSRARGEAHATSDWDLLAVVPDDVPEEQLGPLASWRLRRESRTRADVVTCHRTAFDEYRDTPNTIAYEVAHEGLLVYER